MNKLKFKIADVAKQHGLTNAHGLQKKLECSPTLAARLWKGNFKQISIDTIERLCDLFDCVPSDLYTYTGKNKPVDLRVITPVIAPQLPVARLESEERQSVTVQPIVTNLPELAEGDRWLMSDEVAAGMGTHPSNFARDYKDLPSQKFGRKRFVKLSDFERYKRERR